MTREEFLSRFGTVFENRPDLAAEAWERAAPVDPSAGAEGLHRAVVAVLRNLPPDALLAFLNDHPDLAARSARPADLTPDSQHEQGSAGLDGLDAAAGARLLDMNKRYRERFGFPFIMAVKGRQPAEIMAALEARLRNNAEEERAEAVRQVERILLLRLKDRLGQA
jgi:2-oxo-4-hydroxy-4-carboxy-5-ureidoimidazoline decarboxylase